MNTTLPKNVSKKLDYKHQISFMVSLSQIKNEKMEITHPHTHFFR